MSLTTKPIKIAIIYGGRSSEHSVSCISAGAIMSHLDPEKYELYPIGITQQGTWTVGESDPEKLRSTNGAMPTVTLTKEVSLAAAPGAVPVCGRFGACDGGCDFPCVAWVVWGRWDDSGVV